MTRWNFSQASYTIRVDTDGTVENLNFTPVANRDYFPTGEGEADDTNGNGDGIDLLLDCLNGNGGGGVYSATVSNDGNLTITCTVPFQILWDDVATTLDPAYFGFSVTSPAPAALTDTAPMNLRGLWVPDQGVHRTNWGHRQTVGVSEVAISNTVLGFQLSNDHIFWKIVWIFVGKEFSKIRFASDAGDSNNCIEELFINQGLASFCRFRFYLDWVLNRDSTDTEDNPTLRLANQEDIFEVEEEERLTTYRVMIEALEVP